MRYVAFLRAVNVAGHGIVKMEELRKAFESAGCGSVRTYIQSGNVLFDAAGRGRAALARRIEASLAGTLGSSAPLALRTAADLRRLVESPPFGPASRSEDTTAYVSFLASRPARRPKLPWRSPRGDVEVVSVEGCDAFSLARKVGGRSGYPNTHVEKQLGVPATTRNWSTVTKIAALLHREGTG